MESPERNLLRFLVERDPASPEFWRGVRTTFRPGDPPVDDEFGMWRDVFVQQPLPWGRFLQSALLHTAAVALIWTISIAWIRQQKILAQAAFDRSSLVTYTPEEYLPPLDTGTPEAPKAQKGDPVYAKQPILSVPREADNRTQTIVVPPDLKLDHDVAMPNIVATGAVVPAVPLDATRASSNRLVVPETQVVAPPPEMEFARDRAVQSAMKSDIIAPPPELTQSMKGHVGPLNIGPSDIVAPAPQLTLAEQHSLAARGKGRVPGGSIVPVAPPPSMAGAGGSSSGGRLVALGIHPVAPSGPVVVPGGNRRGTFAAGPRGKTGASGTPELTGSKSDAKNPGGFGTRNQGSLPTGLRVGAADDAHEMAGLATAGPAVGGRSKGRVASPVSEDKITDLDRQVFGSRRPYTTPLNMPNLNSSSGSWEIRFAELDAGHKEKAGDLVAPLATEQSDPGYPLELMRANVQGMVTLYAGIHSDGKVCDIRVLNSPDDRLDSYAARALARWKFAPAERGGKPVAIEALVKIPFRVRRNF